MEMRIMERCGIVVSQIALGCEGFHEPNVNLSDLLDVAQAHGVNLIDLYSPDPAMKGIGRSTIWTKGSFCDSGSFGIDMEGWAVSAHQRFTGGKGRLCSNVPSLTNRCD